MKRKIIIHKKLLVVYFLFVFQSVANAEYRCGWLDNPTQGEYQFTDKSASWTIMSRGGYQLPPGSMKNLPEQLESEYVRTNDRFGYSCACLSVTADASNKRITSILHKGKQVLLKRCLEDKDILRRQDIALKFPEQVYTEQNNRSINSRLARSSGTYSDPSVIAGRPNAEPSTGGYYDEPKISDNVKTSKPRSAAKTKLHYIQVIVTSVPAKAKRLKRSYDKAGFKTIINVVKRKNKVLHKVRIGPYSSRKAVLNSQSRLRKIFKKDQAVQKSIIVGLE